MPSTPAAVASNNKGRPENIEDNTPEDGYGRGRAASMLLTATHT